MFAPQDALVPQASAQTDSEEDDHPTPPPERNGFRNHAVLAVPVVLAVAMSASYDTPSLESRLRLIPCLRVLY